MKAFFFTSGSVRFWARNRVSFQKCREVYLEQIRSGGRSTYTGKNFAKGTVVAISVAFNRLADFERMKNKVYDFDDVNMDFYRDFTAYLKSIGYGLNTVGKTVKIMKTVMRCAEEDGYHNNHNYMAHSFIAPKCESDAIYLTREEVQAITDLDLIGYGKELQSARDIFLGGMDRVVIPCNRALRGILDRYREELLHLSEQKINANLKIIGQMCGIDDEVEIRNTKHETRNAKRETRNAKRERGCATYRYI